MSQPKYQVLFGRCSIRISRRMIISRSGVS
ncbi:hypothetical protein LINPERHAP2_LOCUS45325 [Linum perenne]